ncbi:hypothetical protein D0T53_02805 [Dysgonomonas sp. 216]|uniref:DUF3329 domain-containing protein n=1 Tax=Dysgonomonas sp. 216 TaxID=2302934 RepID=UPI0013D41B39|nr:DUF6056 family protein [Dysgonomonas sp. 216]NDW17846.1 hypothetical protein [Dysgonomonas sp. 216]
MIEKVEMFIDACSQNKILRFLLFALSIIGVFGLILFMNIKTPLLGDDFTYQHIFDTTQKIHSFDDIIQSQQNHYYTWGGRVVVHTIAQLLLMLDPLTADIINSLAFILFIALIYLHINGRKSFSVSLFLGVFLLIWYLEPFGETILWITGSANYMWGSMLILAFLLPFRFYRNGEYKPVQNYIVALIMFVFGTIAGCTNENIAAAMLLMIVLFFMFYRKNKWKIPVWVYTGFAGALIGYFIMIIAPGNAIRAEGTETSIFHIIYRLFRHTQALLNNIGILSLVTLVLFVLQKKKNQNKDVIYYALIYVIATLSAIYVMVFSPAFPERAWFGVYALSIVALGILAVNTNNALIRNIKYSFIILGLLALIFNLFDIYKELNRVEAIHKNRTSLILESKTEGKSTVEFVKYETANKYVVEDPTYSAALLTIFYEIDVRYKK